MKRKAILGIALAGMLAFGAGLGTMAWFTSSVTSKDNTFTAGTLVLNENVPLGSVELDNMQPGDIQDFAFEVVNSGSLDMQYKIQLTDIEGNLTKGPFALQVHLGDDNWQEIHSDYFGGFDVLSNEEKATHTLFVRLPEGAGNDYQGEKGSFVIEVVATQATNSDWDGTVEE